MVRTKRLIDPSAPRESTPPNHYRIRSRTPRGTVQEHFYTHHRPLDPAPLPTIERDDEEEEAATFNEASTTGSASDRSSSPLDFIPMDQTTVFAASTDVTLDLPQTLAELPPRTPIRSPPQPSSATPSPFRPGRGNRRSTPFGSPPFPSASPIGHSIRSGAPTPKPEKQKTKSPTPGPSGIKVPSSPDGSSSGGSPVEPSPPPPPARQRTGLYGGRVTRSRPGALYAIDMDGRGDTTVMVRRRPMVEVAGANAVVTGAKRGAKTGAKTGSGVAKRVAKGKGKAKGKAKGKGRAKK